MDETPGVPELQSRVRSQLVGGEWKQALVVSFPESPPGTTCCPEHLVHLASFHPCFTEGCISPCFYRLENRLRKHEVTCPGAKSFKVAKQRLRSEVSGSKVHSHVHLLGCQMRQMGFEMNPEGKELVRWKEEEGSSG